MGMGPGPAVHQRWWSDDGGRRGGGSSAASAAGSGGDGSGVEPGFLPAAVGLAVEDEFVGGGLESVDGGLG